MTNKLSIKSKLNAEFRRFSLKKTLKFEEFKTELEQLHGLFEIPFFIYYTDPIHGDLLPINNDDNFALAISLVVPCLKLHLQTKGESWIQHNGKKKNFFDNINNLLPSSTLEKNRPHISLPEDFRQVSSIIDVDVLPETHRRVRLVKHGSDKPLGFYIRDGTSVRATMKGLEKVPGIFISRLVPGGLAESTGLLAVNDEVLEVNGIEVLGKTLDQVTDMMVANSSNLIITIRPANQRKPYPMTSYPKASSQPHHQNLNNNISHHSDHRMKSASLQQIPNQQHQQYSNKHASAKHLEQLEQLELNNQRIPHENTPAGMLADVESDDSDDDEVKEHNLGSNQGNEGQHSNQKNNNHGNNQSDNQTGSQTGKQTVNHQSNQTSNQTSNQISNHYINNGNNQSNLTNNINKDKDKFYRNKLKEENGRILKSQDY